MALRIGIVGGGQLGRMLTMAAKHMGYTVVVLDPTPNSPAGQIADKQMIGDFKDAEAIFNLADHVDLLTFEIESANAEALEALTEKNFPVHPSPKVLGIIKDKLIQKQFLRERGIPVADFLEVNSRQEILEAARHFGFPMLLKARKDAYDGRGNVLLLDVSMVDEGLTKLSGRTLYVERFMPFIKELSVIAARNTSGDHTIYPVAETIHKNNINHIVLAPAPISEGERDKAEKLASDTMHELSGIGVFGFEMFLMKDETVLINEIAPRVHNSGHFTIEGAYTSQFEQHIRSITGMPLGDTAMRVPVAVMINILGDRTGPAMLSGEEKLKTLTDVALHIYGKAETRPERKMGHITVIGDALTHVLETAKLARSYISI